MKNARRKWIGHKLQQLRELMGLTLEAFASLIGKKRDCYRSYEEGRAEPSIFTLKAICDLHKITVDEFLKDAPAETAQ